MAENKPDGRERERKFDPIRAEFMISGASDYMPLASAAKGMYDAFVSVGFPDARAYDMTKAYLMQMAANSIGKGDRK